MTDAVVLKPAEAAPPEGQKLPEAKSLETRGGTSGASVDTTQTTTQEAPKPDRPAWLPEEFDTPEEFAEAWKSGKTPEPKAGEEKPPVDEKATQEQAEEAVTKAGLDMAKLSEEFSKDGKLTDESYKALEAAGIPKATVDAYITGQQAQASLARQELAQVVGGEAEMTATLEWAASNLSESERAAANKALTSGDIELAKMALSAINSRRMAIDGREPRLAKGGSVPTAGGAKPYESSAQWIADVNSPQYRNDPAFRDQVMRRVAASNIGG